MTRFKVRPNPLRHTWGRWWKQRVGLTCVNAPLLHVNRFSPCWVWVSKLKCVTPRCIYLDDINEKIPLCQLPLQRAIPRHVTLWEEWSGLIDTFTKLQTSTWENTSFQNPARRWDSVLAASSPPLSMGRSIEEQPQTPWFRVERCRSRKLRRLVLKSRAVPSPGWEAVSHF